MARLRNEEITNTDIDLDDILDVNKTPDINDFNGNFFLSFRPTQNTVWMLLYDWNDPQNLEHGSFQMRMFQISIYSMKITAIY